ncbi:MAG TPA: hypothetical protein VGG34_11075 [Opitutaceae bacterium]
MRRSAAILAAAAALLPLRSLAEALAQPGSPIAVTSDEGGVIKVTSSYLQVRFLRGHPGFSTLAVDAMGERRVDHNVLADAPPAPAACSAERSQMPLGTAVHYSSPSADWLLVAGSREIRASSEYRRGASDPLVLTFDTRRCYATLLGLFNARGDIALPCVLHLPGFGSMRIEGGGPGAALGYASGPGWIRVSFPPASPAMPRATYRMTVALISPAIPGSENDPRLDSFRRNWLNILQLNPNRRLLSNNTDSDSCGFCYYEYADIAAATPRLANGLHALDIVRQSLDRVLAGEKTYGMPGYGSFPEDSADTRPSLLIAAHDYVEGMHDRAWLKARYPALKAMAAAMLATDRDGSGLIEYGPSGNSGTWNDGQPKVRPSNWWDVIGFGHKDAYANALAYRALRGMRQMADEAGDRAGSVRFAASAEKLRGAYFRTFFDPATGVLGGWRSSDGQLHDYWFTFVNGIAVLYGLVPPARAPGIMDRVWDKMRQVGYANFRLGIPGNLVTVPLRDYAHHDPRYGGGLRPDNADGFQVYANGGASASFAYFTIAAFDRVGQHARAEQILYPILAAFDQREFEGTGANGLTNDWRKWDGTSEGYEGFLTDNYYALLAVVGR